MGQGRESAKKFILDKPEVAKKIDKAIDEKLTADKKEKEDKVKEVAKK